MRRRLGLIAAVTFSVFTAAACGGGGGGGGAAGSPTPTGSQTPTGTPTPSGTQPPGGSFTPLKIGNVWHYTVTSPGSAAITKDVTVAANEDIGAAAPTMSAKAGIMGFRLDTASSTGGSQKEWHVDQGAVVLRERAQVWDATPAIKSDAYYDPSKLYVDQTAAHTVTGATWTESYTDHTTTATNPQPAPATHLITWTVLSSNDSVTVGAGTFPCLKLHRQSSLTATSGSDKTYWFSQGVGKVKEIDLNPANPTGTPTQTEELTSYTIIP